MIVVIFHRGEGAAWRKLSCTNVLKAMANFTNSRYAALMRVHGVSDAAITAAGEALSDSVDMLLDRLATKAVGAPVAGTPLWNAQWSQRDEGPGVERRRRHLLTRVAIASTLGLATREDAAAAMELGASAADIAAARGLPVPPPPPHTPHTPPPRRRAAKGADQLPMW